MTYQTFHLVHTIYAVCLLQANIKSDRLLERACKNAKSKIHSFNSVGANNSLSHPVLSGKKWKRNVLLSICALPSSLYSCSSFFSLVMTKRKIIHKI